MQKLVRYMLISLENRPLIILLLETFFVESAEVNIRFMTQGNHNYMLARSTIYCKTISNNIYRFVRLVKCAYNSRNIGVYRAKTPSANYGSFTI